jgi:hypothetical protein
MFSIFFGCWVTLGKFGLEKLFWSIVKHAIVFHKTVYVFLREHFLSTNPPFKPLLPANSHTTVHLRHHTLPPIPTHTRTTIPEI